jgi:hypothetical protein
VRILDSVGLLIPELKKGPNGHTMGANCDQAEKSMPNILWIQKTVEELGDLNPIPYTARSLSRTALLLAEITKQAAPILNHYLASSPFLVGTYCATDPGPVGHSYVERLSKEFTAKDFRQVYPPKQYLKHLPITAAACPGIFLGAKGAAQVFTHSLYATYHALKQAKADIRMEKIEAALICTAYSLEDPLLAIRGRHLIPASRTLSEGAAYLVLTKYNLDFKLREEDHGESAYPYFGIADPLIQTLLRNEALS